MLKPEDFGVSAVNAADITGGDSVADSAGIFMNILQAKGSQAQNNVVCANAGMAIATAKGISPKKGFGIAQASLAEGKALAALRSLQELSKD